MRWSFSAAIMLLFAVAAFSQDDHIPAPRKKIALVLEGGGALGLAHVGVIDWFEKNRIPVDYVAGTSMGGLIGGLYAMGNNPEEIHKIVAGVDWDTILTDRIDYSDLAFRRKEDRRAYPNNLEFGIRTGIRFPEGFNSGHQVGLLLDRLTLPYSNLKSFDDLPIPFRCVGVDMASDKEHVFKDGSLGNALRSTMSLPGIFSPVRQRDNIYVDGGLLNNLPVNVGRDMGADIVIAVHLRVKPLDPQKPLSLFGVMAQSISVVVAANELRSMEKADILVTVDLSEFSSSEYEKYDPLIEAGFKAAMEKANVLQAYSLSQEDWAQYASARDTRKAGPPPVPQFLTVNAGNPKLAEEIRHRLSSYAGKPFNEQKLETELDRIVGTGRFARLGYQLTQENGQVGLSIKATEKDYATAILNPLITIDGSDYRNPLFALGARATAFDLGRVGSEWRIDAVLGSEYGVTSEFYDPVQPFSRWFFAPRATADTAPFDIDQRDIHLSEYQITKYSGAIDLGVNFQRKAQLRAGYELGSLKEALVIGSPVLPSVSGRYGITSLKFSLDTLDSPIVPRDGTEILSNFEWHDSAPAALEAFPSTEALLTVFKKVSVPGSVYLRASGGSTFGFQETGLPTFSLGGPQRLAAYGRNELLTNQYLLGRVGYLQRMFGLPTLLGGNVYFTGAYELGKAYGVPGASRLPMDGVAGVILETAFGPVFLGGSVGDSGHQKFFFQLGKLF